MHMHTYTRVLCIPADSICHMHIVIANNIIIVICTSIHIILCIQSNLAPFSAVRSRYSNSFRTVDQEN